MKQQYKGLVTRSVHETRAWSRELRTDEQRLRGGVTVYQSSLHDAYLPLSLYLHSCVPVGTNNKSSTHRREHTDESEFGQYGKRADRATQENRAYTEHTHTRVLDQSGDKRNENKEDNGRG